MKTELIIFVKTLLDDVPKEIKDASAVAFSLLKYVCLIAGAIVAIVGGVKLGTSIASQDPSSRQKAIFVICGGVLIAAAPFIVQLLIPGAFA